MLAFTVWIFFAWTGISDFNKSLCGCRLYTTAEAGYGAAAQAGSVGLQGKQPAYKLGRDLSAKLEHLYSLQQVGATRAAEKCSCNS